MPTNRIQPPAPLRRQATLRSRAMRGDQAAFAELYRRHSQELYRYSLSILRNPDDASDALQNSMVKAFSALKEEERDFDVVPWLFRIVHNESITVLRKRRPVTSIERVAEVGEDSLARSVADRARLAELQADLQLLGERQRSALIMRELSGLSHQEIGIALNCSTSAAKQAIFEARTGLTELQEGRAMDCEIVERALSDADGRVLRNRKVRAHLSDCATCSAFRDAIATRQRDLAALAPALPATALAGILTSVLGSSGGATAGAGTATGSLIAGGAIGKGIAAVGITATLAGGVVTANRVSSHHDSPSPTTPASIAAPAAASGGVSAVKKTSDRQAATTPAPAPPSAKAVPAPAATAKVRPAAATAKTEKLKKPKKPKKVKPAKPAKPATPAKGKSELAPGKTKTTPVSPSAASQGKSASNP